MPMSQEQANDLLDRLRLVESWKPAAKRTRAPAWFPQLWTQVTVLVADDPVEHVDGELRQEPDGPRGELQVFTAGRIVHAELAADGKTRVWATSRKLLQRVEVTGGAPFTASAGTDWPGPVRIRAVYPDEVLELPAGELNHQQWEQFHHFLSSLLADLGCGHQPPHREEQHHRAGWAW